MDMLAMVDAEIEKLNAVRRLLIGNQEAPALYNGKPRGRKPGTKMSTTRASAVPSGIRKTTMSPEGRQRIAEAMKARWAAKRVASEPTPAKKSAKKAAS